MSFKNKPLHAEITDKKLSYNFDVRPILSDKCFTCHGPDANKRAANLRLDDPKSAFAPLASDPNIFAIVPGNAEKSELYKRIISDDPTYMMPAPRSHLGKLSEEEILTLKTWITQGAHYEKHWAFTSPAKAELPTVKNTSWCSNEIDYFILDKIENAGLKPNARADNARLLKRISLDITGLPPTLQQQADFAKPFSKSTYEKQIDKLFAAKQYGEKMALLWLDFARYSDSYGYQDDGYRTQWPYRDWVIHAFNKNMPYHHFIKWQLAGDMLPGSNLEQKLATAFLRNHKYTEEGGVIPEEYRVEYILDKIKTYSRSILGVSLECAQCHDHKYDPFSQKEFYEMFAFFNTSYEEGFEGDITATEYAKKPKIVITKKEVDSILHFINLGKETKVAVSVMDEMKDTTRTTYILKRGVYDLHGDSVGKGVPEVIMPFGKKEYQQNRIGLADWTISKSNPLTARVFVNIIWQEIFGRGLVRSASDFGMQGQLPSHPELLDWLAVDFMDHNWDIQYLLKKIFTSSTYQQSAIVNNKQLEIDPENILLSHAPRMRVKAELVKDIVMKSAGLLVATIGGASVKTYQPKGIWEAATSGRGNLRKYTQDHDSALYRRGMYTFIKLTVPPPQMIMFDASNRDQCEVYRVTTNTPLQALIMMNDPMVLEASRFLSQNLLLKNKDINAVIATAFKRIICRTPDASEQKILQDYFNKQYKLFSSKSRNAALVLQAGEFKQIITGDKNKEAALMQTISMIYNMEEAITKT